MEAVEKASWDHGIFDLENRRKRSQFLTDDISFLFFFSFIPLLPKRERQMSPLFICPLRLVTGMC